MPGRETLSIIIPLYKSEENLPRLFSEMERIASIAPIPVELVFVNDGSPDRCGELVEQKLPDLTTSAKLLQLSRNFGSFAAISAGLQYATGDYFTIQTADLQEPPELALEFLERMRHGDADVTFGQRIQRDDPMLSMLGANLFWALYRRLVNRAIPPGGVDVFGCNRKVRDQICSMKEVETSLVALLFWIGYRRALVPYRRQPRREGKSAWSLSKKLQYLVNSVFNFTDLPIRALLACGFAGMGLAVLGAATVLFAKVSGQITVPGYAATVLAVFFFGGLTTLGLGIVGQYLWLCLRNTHGRPLFILASQTEHSGPGGWELEVKSNQLRSSL